MPRRRATDFDAVDQIATAQGGLILRRQLVEAGVAPSTISEWTRTGGHWRRPLPALYALQRAPLSPRQRERAALLYAGTPSVLSGLTALRHLGVRYLPGDPDTDPVLVLIDHPRRRSSSGFVVVERTTSLPDPVVVQGLPLAPLPRAVYDACRRYPNRRATRALILEVIQSGRVTLEELRDLRDRRQRQWTALLREALADADRGVASAPEAELADVIGRSGLPLPLFNVDLRTPSGEFIACPDGYYEEAGVALEVNSEEHHARGALFERTVSRQARMTAHGIVVLPILPRTLRRDPDGVVREIRQALDIYTGRRLPNVVLGPPPAR